jgi:hypothetical protein
METIEAKPITVQQILAIYTENQTLRDRAEQAEKQLERVGIENKTLKARIARAETNYRTLYRKSVQLRQRVDKEHKTALKFRDQVDEFNLIALVRQERIDMFIRPWKWELWQHVKNYVNLCLGRPSVGI